MILAVYRAPFAFTPTVERLPHGLTLAEMAARMPGLPDDFATDGVICLAGHPVPRALWHAVRPKPALPNGCPVEVTFHAPILGGGGGEGGGKNILSLVASIALVAATGFVAGGGLATRFGLGAFAQGTVAANLAAAGVSLLGSALLSSLAPPPAVDGAGIDRDTRQGASAEGNVLDPYGGIPRVIGERKVYPSFVCEPLVLFDGPDEVVEVAYGLAGPHRISDIRVRGVPIADLAGVEVQVTSGWPGEPGQDMLRRYGRTELVQQELRGHVVSETDGTELAADDAGSSALPQPYRVLTRAAPDEHHIQIAFPQGLFSDQDDSRMRVPLRIRMRPAAGGAWINLPELHFAGDSPRPVRATIVLAWGEDPPLAAPSVDGFVEARLSAPAQNVQPIFPMWVSDASFFTGSGDAWLSANNIGSTRLRRIALDRYSARIGLDPAVFPPGRWEIEILRGVAVPAASWNSAAYTVDGLRRDLFAYAGTAPRLLPATRSGVTDSLALVRSVSTWNRTPTPSDRIAVIAMRARNRSIERVSCVAGGWVPDWDGTGWRDWSVTDNPVPHYVDILSGMLGADPLPLSVLDNAELVAWRSACATNGWTCNALIEGQTVDEAARIVAACGYARPYASEVWGVVRDRDRSAEVPVQILSQRNSSGLSWTKSFARPADGFRVTFRDAADDYEPRQITVWRPGHEDGALLEEVTYEGITTEAAARTRAAYDLAAIYARTTVYSLEAPAEALVCRRGSLVGLVHDSLDRVSGSGRVVEVRQNGGGDITHVRLDQAVPVAQEGTVDTVANMATVADVSLLGRSTGIVLRRSAGGPQVFGLSVSTGQSDLLALADPADPAGIVPGILAAVGPLHREVRRMIVAEMTPREDLVFGLSLVDEAPEIHA